MSENKGNGQAMVIREADSSALAMVMEPSEALQRLKELQAFVAHVMVEGEDYGTLPGAKPDKDGNPPKKILLQPGAQKLAEVYGLAVEFTDERPPIERWDDGDPMFAYFKRATVKRRKDGLFLGSGVGSCNSKEKKYASRWVGERDVPPGLDLNRLPRREVNTKRGVWVQYKVPNPEIFDLVNTIEKMACKRALVGAVISVTRSSALFTQDMDDVGGEKQRPAQRHDEEQVHEGEFEEEPPRAPPQRPAAKNASDYLRDMEADTSEDAARKVIREARGLPKARAHAWRRLIASAPSMPALNGIVAEIRADELPADVVDKLMLEADAKADGFAKDAGDDAGGAK